MVNYFNILPIILLDVFIILIFEGILFFTYLLKLQEDLVKKQLLTYIERITEFIIKNQNTIINIDQIKDNIYKIKDNLDNHSLKLISTDINNNSNNNSNNKINSQIINEIKDLLNELEQNKELKKEDLNLLLILNKTLEKENKFIENNKKKGLYIFLLIILFIVISFITYCIVVNYYFVNVIEWKKIFIIVIATIILIIIMEALYVVYILFNKKINTSKLKLDLLQTIV